MFGQMFCGLKQFVELRAGMLLLHMTYMLLHSLPDIQIIILIFVLL